MSTIYKYIAVLLLYINMNCCTSAVTGYSSLRKDYYLPQSLYDESFVKTMPNSGGRGHIVWTETFHTNYTLPLTVSFNNNKLKVTVSPSFNLMPSGLDWIHCDIKINTALNTASYAVTFHTRSDAVISNIGSSLIITDKTNKQITSTTFKFPPIGTDFNDNYPVWCTYIASSDNFNKIYIHLHNYDKSKSYLISNLLLNGVNIDNNIKINDNSHLLKVYDDITSKYKLSFNEGDLWTVSLQINSSSNSPNIINLGYGGRFIKEFIAFESYSKSGQCPFPGANTNNYNLLWNELKIETGFCQTGTSICNQPNLDNILSASQATDEGYKILAGEHWSKTEGLLNTKYYSAIIGLEMGDEVDSHYNNTYQQWVKSLNRRLWYYSLPTYQGSHVNHYVGAFAGITDIQSCDYYCAGCAPHVTSTKTAMRIQGSRDYLFNTRQNHKPLVTWGYSQAFYGTHIHGNEYLAQLTSVFSAGCKGVQLFQSDINQKSSNSDEWNDAKNIMSSMYKIKEYFRIGDLMEMNIEVNGKPIINEQPEMINIIRSDNMLVVIILSTNCSGYNQVLCTSATHWTWNSMNINELKINFNTNDLKLTRSNNMISEVKNGNIEPSTNNVINGATFIYNDGDNYFVIKNIAMGENPTIVRLFLVPVVNQ